MINATGLMLVAMLGSMLKSCHPERSEGSRHCLTHEILRFAQNDTRIVTDFEKKGQPV
jgi:hypothetical protein